MNNSDVNSLAATDLRFSVCVQNTGSQVSLTLHKIYRVLPDDEARKLGFLRVIDESGEAYLYPKTYFVAVDLPEALKTMLLRAA